MNHMHEALARGRYQEDLAQADRRRLARALQAQRRAQRRQLRADRALTRATQRLALAHA